MTDETRHSPAETVSHLRLNLTVERWALVKPDAFLSGSMVQARNVLEMAVQDIAKLAADRDRVMRNRDMWKDQCERQAEQLTAYQRPEDK